MSRKFLTALDLAKNELQNPRAHQLGAAPSSPVTGQFYYNTGDNTLYWWDNTQWVSARGGAAATPPATTTSLGTIQLGGDLTGTATVPVIANNAITSAKIADNTIQSNDLQDNAVTTAKIVNGAVDTTKILDGTIVIADTSTAFTFDALATSRPPVASVNMNGQRIINMLDPIGSNEATTKNYVDNATQGMDPKNSVKAASLSNLTLSGTQTVDGIALIANDRVLVKNQTTTANNGIYLVAAGAWTRAPDMDSWPEVPGATTFVEQGTQADTAWLCTSDQGGTLNTTAITWTQFGAGTTYTSGTGITIAGNVISQDQAYTDGRYWNATGGETGLNGLFQMSGAGTGFRIADFIQAQDVRIFGDGIQWTSPTNTYIGGISFDIGNQLMKLSYTTGTIRLDSPAVTVTSDPDQPMEVATKQYVDSKVGAAGTVKKYSQSLGNSLAQTIQHNLNTKDTVVSVYRVASPFDEVDCDIEHLDANNTIFRFSVVPAINEYRAVIVG